MTSRVTFDRGTGLRRPAHFRFAPKGDVRSLCEISRNGFWLKNGLQLLTPRVGRGTGICTVRAIIARFITGRAKIFVSRRSRSPSGFDTGLGPGGSS